MTTDASSSSQFTLSYEGTALADHSMSVRDLAPALVALGELFDRSNYLVNDDRATIDLKITATGPGSFGIELVVEMVRLTTNIFAGPVVTSALNLRQIVVLCITSLKYLKGDHALLTNQSDEQFVEAMETVDLKIRDIELRSVASPETTRLALQTIHRVSRDPPFRENVRRVVAPVSQNGIDRVEFKDSKNVLESVEEDDLPSFDPFPEESDISAFIIPRQALKVISPYLGPGTGQWRLHDGDRANRYDMMDPNFANDVKNSVVDFRSGDFLECQVRHIQWIESDGNIRTTREILRVLRHRPRTNGGVQLRSPDVQCPHLADRCGCSRVGLA